MRARLIEGAWRDESVEGGSELGRGAVDHLLVRHELTQIRLRAIALAWGVSGANNYEWCEYIRRTAVQ